MSKQKKGKPKRLRNVVEPSRSYGKALTDAQIEERRTKRRNAVITVMGDDSGRSRQNADYLDFAFQSLLLTFSATGKSLAEEAIRETLPAELLQLAIHVAWIPFLDEDGNPYPEMLGEVEVAGYEVTQDFYDAFRSLLPIEELVDYYKMPWASPTPADIIEEVLEELSWKKLQLIEQMQIDGGTQYKLRRYEIDGKKVPEHVRIDPRDAKERHRLDNLLVPPLPISRRNTAQEDTRQTLAQVIRKHSTKYATIKEEQLRWRRP